MAYNIPKIKQKLKKEEIEGLKLPFGVGSADVKTRFGVEVMNKLPHGSGIDSDWTIKETSDKIYAYNSYHTMNDNGFYVGYQDFYIIIPKKDPENFKLHFQGSQYLAQKYMLRDYLEETIMYALEEIDNKNEREIKALKEILKEEKVI